MSTSTVPMDDKELFNAATTDEQAEQNTDTQAKALVEAVETQNEGTQGRDDRGRFVARQGETEQTQQQPEVTQPAAQQQQARDTDGGNVPSWRLREVNEAREAAERRANEIQAQHHAVQRQMQALERQLADLKAPKEAPDPYTDFNGALEHRLSPFEQRMQQAERISVMNSSKALAIAGYGKQAVADMEAALEEAGRLGNPELEALGAQMSRSNDPVEIAMQWHQRSKLLKETGGDLGAYKNRALEEALKDPAFLAKAVEAARLQAGSGQNGKPNSTVQLPPSLSRVASAASPHDEDNDASDRALFSHAARR